jgi:hypothetical protein
MIHLLEIVFDYELLISDADLRRACSGSEQLGEYGRPQWRASSLGEEELEPSLPK